VVIRLDWAGWQQVIVTVLRYGWVDVVEEPCLVARQVATALALGGWPGDLAPFPRCRMADAFIGGDPSSW
jgi:hypothetical protein